MMLKREANSSNPPPWRKWIRAGTAALAAAASAVTFSAGCLDRPVTRQEPNTSNVYVAEIRQTAVDKIDLLFMIDNSISMADKQEILKQAVPILVQRLVTPVCLDDEGRNTGNVNNDGECARGSSPEFSPIKDIHIAIVTSSLGAHGGQICDGRADPSENDRALPLGRVRAGLMGPEATWAGTGFLAWDPDAAQGRPRNMPEGVSNQNTFVTQFTNMVAASGEVGCGYEASLEAWYRFLIDPDPPSSVESTKDANGDPINTVAVINPPDTVLLELRSKFLRRDSLVAIIMLTDENDCSVVDAGQSWLVGLQTYGGSPFRMPTATKICETDPNNRCCRSCAGAPEAGCSATDENCPNAASSRHQPLTDHPNLRCYNQRQRFGFDLLHPISRYVNGLTQPTVENAERVMKPNPLFEGAQRDPSLVFLAGIVGVPWQDVATPESVPPNAPLEYMTYEELKNAGRLDWILAPAAGGFPLDPLMYETPLDRTKVPGLPQTHPATGDTVAAAVSVPTPGPGPNRINGRESNIYDQSDLQYACIFPLGTKKTNCTNSQTNCDCTPSQNDFFRPLCDGNTQEFAKAYPGTRHLEVLRGFGDLTQNAIIASICPKVSDPNRSDDPSYGYTPAVAAIIERLKEALRGKCLPRQLAACNCAVANGENCSDPGEVPCQQGKVPGNVSCSVIEARLPDPGEACPPCENMTHPGRFKPDDGIIPAVDRLLDDLNHCGTGQGEASCDSFCKCEIRQFTGADLDTCRTQATTPTNIYGYCYVDPLVAPEDQQDAARTIVASCPSTQQRLLRFAGTDVPRKGSIALIACLGGNVQQ